MENSAFFSAFPVSGFHRKTKMGALQVFILQRSHFYLPGGINESENHFQPTPGTLWTNSKGAGSKFVDKNAGDNAVKHAK
ncbi:MAG: hypothetical protein ACLUIO_27575, partial [Neglectibacter timonensis]